MRRVYQNDSPYFITARTIKLSHALFEDIKHAEVLAQTILSARNVYLFDLYAFAIMPDHFHLLLKTRDNEANVSKIMQGIKAIAYKEIASLLSVRDPFWQKSFHCNVKDTPQLIDVVIKYMRNNPVKWSLPEVCLDLPYQFYNSEFI